MGTTARLLFAALGFVALATLAVQLSLNMQEWEGVGVALWKMARYFTLWTAALVAFSSLYIAASPSVSDIKSGLAAAIVLFASVVGFVYHFLLAPTDDPQGLWAITNILLHYVIPVGVVLAWFFVAPKGKLLWRAPVVWLIFPLIYIVLTVTRGAYTEEYPYFFLDISKHGYSAVGVNSAGLFAAFLIGGFFLVVLDRLMASGEASAGTARS